MVFLELFIRQAHPGPAEPPYRTFDEKLRDAQRYARDERLPWRLAVDDLEGRTHQVYGALSDPAYLVDAAGRVAFYSVTTHAPTLYRAIEGLLAQGATGVVGSGATRTPHMGPAMTDGWRALARGRPQSTRDLHRIFPGSPWALRAGQALQPVLGPVTLRERPLPRWPLLLAAALGAALALRSRR